MYYNTGIYTAQLLVAYTYVCIQYYGIEDTRISNKKVILLSPTLCTVAIATNKHL